MIDPANYSTIKSGNSVVSISQVGDAITLTSKSFCPITGTPNPNNVDTFSASNLYSQISTYQASLTSINAIISSLQELISDA